MKQELDLTQLEMMAHQAYGEFTFAYKVLRNANTTKEDEKDLIAKVYEQYKKCDELYSQIEGYFASQTTRDSERYLLQTVNEFRKGMEEFRNLYINDSEPNA